jgi:hypothetical protein
MKKFDLRWLWFLFAIGIVFFLWSQPTPADDGHGHNHHDGGGDNTTNVDVTGGDVNVPVDVGVQTGDMIGGDTNVSTGGNKTFAFSHSLGDVDINEGQNCLGSEAWGTFIVSRQTNELNPWCAALFYELNGKHEFAAKMRCDIKEVRKKYTTDDECWADQNLGVPDVEPDAAEVIVEEFNTTQMVQDKQLYDVQMEQQSLEDRIAALEKKPAPRPRVIQQAAPEPEPELSDEEKYAILNLLIAGKENEDE